MINYELAKQLKDAGFPLDQCYLQPFIHNGKLEILGFPTLEELIEACGDGFDSFQVIPREVGGNTENKWWALPKGHKESGSAYWGKTPTEAVARLWLALNEHEENID